MWPIIWFWVIQKDSPTDPLASLTLTHVIVATADKQVDKMDKPRCSQTSLALGLPPHFIWEKDPCKTRG